MRHLKTALLLGFACAAVSVQAQEEMAQSSVQEVAQSTPDLSGLWVISNRSSRGFLDENMEPLEPEDYLNQAGLEKIAVIRPAFDPSAMCLPAIPRQISGPYPIEIVQRQGRVAMLFEWDTVFRLIYTDGREHPDPLDDQRFMGHAVAHWEDGVLIVDTANFNGKTWLSGAGLPLTTQAHLTERYWLEEEGKTLRGLLKIEDPTFLTRPIYRNFYFNLRNDWQIREYICSEGNRDNVFQQREGEEGALTVDDVIVREE